MPIKQNQKTYNDLASKDKIAPKAIVLTAGLFIVNEENKVGAAGEGDKYGKFLINPSSFEDSKNSNWVQHNVPGQSDPVLQWVSSGARTLTFDALVTNDISSYVPTGYTNNEIASEPNTMGNYFANIAGSLANVKEKNVKFNTGQTLRPKLDITVYLNYYRSLLYPKYKNEKSGDEKNTGRRLFSEGPPRLVLLAGRAITNSTFKLGEMLNPEDETWVLTDLKVKTTKMLPNLAPMEAIVSFTLVQYNAQSSSSDNIFNQKSWD